MAGLQGMQGAEAHGNGQRDQDNADTQLWHGDQVGEGTTRGELAVDCESNGFKTRPHLA